MRNGERLMEKFPIQQNRDEVIRDLKETDLSLEIIGDRYGVTKQALSHFMKREQIERPLRPSRLHGHQVEKCPVCRRLLEISKTPHSEFLTARTIRDRLGTNVSYDRYLHHLRVLKQKGLVHQKFGCLASKKLERAYGMYLTEKLPVSTIERLTGVKGFAATIRRHRKYGLDVPPPLFVYKGKERSRIVREANDRRRRESKGPVPEDLGK